MALLSHIRVCTDWNRFYHAMIVKKEDEPEPNIYLSVFMAWDEHNGKSNYKRHFKGTSEQDVIDKFNAFLKGKDKKEISSILKY